jgi:ABC-type glycerol-3-phosphate transport system substrate-binding protein
MISIKQQVTRRQFLKVAGLAGVSVGLAAYGAAVPVLAAPPAQAKRKIRVTAIPGPAGNNIKYAADNFMKKYPDIEVQVDVAGGAETEYKPNFPQIAVSADRPDAAWYWVDGRQYQDLVAAGALEPLDDIYESEGLDKAYPEATLTKYTSPDGHRYAVNTDVVWYPQIYYNKAIFKECGVEPPANGLYYETTDEWYGVCDKFRAKGYEPVTVGAKEGWRIGHCHDTLLQRMIPQELLDDLYNNWRPGSKPKISYNGPEWLAVDKMLKEWYDKGVFAEGDLGRSYAEGRAIFVQKKAAMYQDGSWAVGILRSEAPDVDFGWMHYPQVKPEIKPRFLLYAGNGFMVPKDPSDKDAAMKFAAYVTSLEYETLMVQNKDIGFVPSRVDVPQDAMGALEPMVREMWLKLLEMGTSTGWDDPVPADMAERSFILFQEMLTGVRSPESVGEEIEKLAERHRQKA